MKENKVLTYPCDMLNGLFLIVFNFTQYSDQKCIKADQIWDFRVLGMKSSKIQHLMPKIGFDIRKRYQIF